MRRNSPGSFTNHPTSEKNSNPMPNKTVEMENKAMAEVVSLSAEKEVPLEEMMKDRITDECYSIFPQTEVLNLSKCWIGRKPLIGSCKQIFLSWTWDSCGGWQHLLLKTEKRMMVPHLRGRITHQSYLSRFV